MKINKYGYKISRSAGNVNSEWKKKTSLLLLQAKSESEHPKKWKELLKTQKKRSGGNDTVNCSKK